MNERPSPPRWPGLLDSLLDGWVGAIDLDLDRIVLAEIVLLSAVLCIDVRGELKPSRRCFIVVI